MSELTNRASGNLDYAVFQSDIVALAAEASIAGIRSDLSNCFIGIKYFADSEGAAPATPGAGTVQLSTVSISSLSEDLGSAVDATGNAVTVAQGNFVSVKGVPTGLTVATHYRITISQNV